MQPAVHAAFDYSVPLDQLTRMIRRAGFEAVALGGKLDHTPYHTEEGVRWIQSLCRQSGLSVVSIHAPTPQGAWLFSIDETKRQESVRLCKAALDAARVLDAGHVVAHVAAPLPDPAEQERALDAGFDSIRALADHAAQRGVFLALENWTGPYNQVLSQFMDAFPDEPVVFCYDAGHEHADGTGLSVLERYGARLRVVHLHDNTGRDTHSLPFDGDVDWPRLIGLLRRFGYTGSLLLEAMVKGSAIKDPELFLAETMKRAQRLMVLAANLAPPRHDASISGENPCP